jgi:hypothetical protein
LKLESATKRVDSPACISTGEISVAVAHHGYGAKVTGKRGEGDGEEAEAQGFGEFFRVHETFLGSPRRPGEALCGRSLQKLRHGKFPQRTDFRGKS